MNTLTQIRAAIAHPVIGETNLTDAGILGFHRGYDLAKAGDLPLTDGVVDLLNEALADTAAVEYHMGKLVGFCKHHEMLLAEMEKCSL